MKRKVILTSLIVLIAVMVALGEIGLFGSTVRVVRYSYSELNAWLDQSVPHLKVWHLVLMFIYSAIFAGGVKLIR